MLNEYWRNARIQWMIAQRNDWLGEYFFLLPLPTVCWQLHLCLGYMDFRTGHRFLAHTVLLSFDHVILCINPSTRHVSDSCPAAEPQCDFLSHILLLCYNVRLTSLLENSMAVVGKVLESRDLRTICSVCRVALVKLRNLWASVFSSVKWEK